MVALLAVQAGEAQTPWPPPTCEPPFNAYGCVLATWDANATGTAAARTATAPFNTPTPIGGDFFPTRTGFAPSDVCPSGVWDASNLDPAWSAACRHCLPAGATETPGGLSLPSFSTYVVGVPEFETSTPSPTATVTNTPAATVTAAPYTYWVYTSVAERWPLLHTAMSYSEVPALEYQASGRFANGGVYSAVLGVWFPNVPFRNLTGYSFDVSGSLTNVSGNSAVGTLGILLSKTDAAGNLLQGVDLTTANYLNNGWRTKTGTVSMSFMAGQGVMVSISNTGGVGGYDILSWSGRIRNIQLSVSGGSELTPTPSPTATNTPMPTLTPPRSLRPLANCTMPVYRTEEQAVDMEFEAEGNTCYRIFPEIDTNIVGNVIQVRAVDLCFQWWSPAFNIMGIVIDLQFFVAVSLAFFLFRWGMNN